jgi:hypothetical protein
VRTKKKVTKRGKKFSFLIKSKILITQKHKTLENTTHTTFANTSEKNTRGRASVQKCILLKKL